jgi:hypothetical protein
MSNNKVDEMSQMKEEALVAISKAAEKLRELGVSVSIPGYDEMLVEFEPGH